MDDLDHSVHLAERDWESFNEESEECCLLQPTLAGPDDSGLSDSEDLEGAARPAVDISNHEPKQIACTRTPPSEPNVEGLRKADEGCTILQLQSCQTGLGDTQPDNPPDTPGKVSAPLKMSVILTISSESQKPYKSNLDHSEKDAATKELTTTERAEQDTEVTDKSITDDQMFMEQSVMAEPVHDEGSALESSNHAGGASSGFSDLTDLEAISENKQKEGGTSSTLSEGIISQSASPNRQHAELHKNPELLCCPDQAACQSASCEAPRGEKERWFVTVNDNTLQQRRQTAPLAKKKRRKKLVKICRSSDDNVNTSDSTDNPYKCGPGLEKDRVNKSEVEDMENFPQSCHNSTAQPTSPICTDLSNGHLFSDLKQITITSSFEDKISSEFPSDSIDDSKMLIVKHDLTDSLEQMVTHGVLTNNNHMTFTHINENAPKMDSTDSQELKDDTDFFSTASFDSDEYFLATDSAEEPQQLHHEAQWNLTLMTQNIVSEYTLSATSTSSTQQITGANLQSDVDEDLPQEHESYKDTSDCTYFDSDKTCPHIVHSNHPMPPHSSMIKTCDSPHRSLSDTKMEKTVHEDSKLLADCELLAQANMVGDADRCPTPLLPAVTVTPCSVPESPERYTPLVPTRPVYAISAFWDEMEKLTIKDILQLRKTRSPSPIREAHQLPTTTGEQVDVIDTHVLDNSIADSTEYLLTDGPQVDPSDTADSDYFTHLDDSKPDRSSCEFSTFSDFDEEYMQFIGASTNPSPEPQDIKLQGQMSNELMYYKGSLQEEDVDLGTQGNHVDVEQQTVQGFGDCIPNSLFSDNDTFLRGLTKSKSMRNVNAFEMEVQLKDISLHSILEQAERSLIHSTCQVFEDSPFLEVNGNITPRTRSPSPIFTNVDIIDQQYQISFPEVFECLFEDDEPRDNCTALIYDPQSTSVPEISNCSLSKYGSGMLLSPLQLSQGNEGEPVPIFSCSHSAPRDLTFPELDYPLFPLDTYAESEGEDDSSPIRVVTRDDIQSQHAGSTTTASYGYQQLFNRDVWQMDWKRLLSLRRICFPGKGSSWCRRSGAWVFPPASHRKLTDIDTDNQVTEMVKTRITSMPPQVIQLGQQIFRELAEQHRQLFALQTSVLIRRRDGLHFALKQSDMCLVCIAFSSWVLRSTDPQAVDAWKAALLANVSAISAIQYLRRYMRRKPTEEEP
ncbi:uncharacterized protein perm1b [Osmerus mordax]|uniref:uncharacterized protein perm1b n=1 Tax=Osmerus mordax TaxID=8014 RepID=UPI00350EA143